MPLPRTDLFGTFPTRRGTATLAIMASVNDRYRSWAAYFTAYRAAALLTDRDLAYRQRTAIVRQARQLLGRRHGAQRGWLFDALQGQDLARTEFITSVLAANVPRSVVPAMIRAGVQAPDRPAKRRFIEPCVRSYGHRWITDLLVRYLAEGTRDERTGAATALYWAAIQQEVFWYTGFVIGARDLLPTRAAQAQFAAWRPLRDQRTALLVEVFHATDDHAARWSIVQQLFLDPEVPEAALHALGHAARDLAVQSDNRYVRWRALRLDHGFASDRAASSAALGIIPWLCGANMAYQATLRRCARFLAAQGLDQFLDLDSSRFPYQTLQAAAQGVNPRVDIVYVRSDPVQAAFIDAIVRDQPGLTLVQADVLDPQAVLQHPKVVRQLDAARPVGLLLLAGLPFAEDAHARHIVQTYREALPIGSYLVIGHSTPQLAHDSHGGIGRTADQMAAFFAGLELIDPGIVDATQWRSDVDDDPVGVPPEPHAILCGVGRKG